VAGAAFVPPTASTGRWWAVARHPRLDVGRSRAACHIRLPSTTSQLARERAAEVGDVVEHGRVGVIEPGESPHRRGCRAGIDEASLEHLAKVGAVRAVPRSGERDVERGGIAGDHDAATGSDDDHHDDHARRDATRRSTLVARGPGRVRAPCLHRRGQSPSCPRRGASRSWTRRARARECARRPPTLPTRRHRPRDERVRPACGALAICFLDSCR
jgi:hypothetical protein